MGLDNGATVAPRPGRAFAGLTTQAATPEAVDVAIIGVPTAKGSGKDGAQYGPALIRNGSAHMRSEGTTSVDASTAEPWGAGCVDLGDIVSVYPGELENEMRSATSDLSPSAVVGWLGGDHSLTAASVAELRSRRGPDDLAVVQFDHHLDLQASPPTVREELFNTNVMSHVADAIGKSNIYQVGVAQTMSVDNAETTQILESLSGFGARVPAMSPTALDFTLLATALPSSRDVYVTVDVDVLPSHSMQSTGYPAEYGTSLETLIFALNNIATRNRIVGFDIVELAARPPFTRVNALDASRAAFIVWQVLRLCTRQLEGTR